MEAIKKMDKGLTIKGTILPSEWEKNGHVTGISIGAEDGQDYIIFLNRIGEELFKFIHRRVEATGTVKDVYGDLVFTIHKYSIVKENKTERQK